jgi:hypothetical protein
MVISNRKLRGWWMAIAEALPSSKLGGMLVARLSADSNADYAHFIHIFL